MKYIVEIINVCNEHHGNKQFKIIHELIKLCKVRLGLVYLYILLTCQYIVLHYHRYIPCSIMVIRLISNTELYLIKCLQFLFQYG